MLHYFNPGHETAVLNGSPYYTPAANPLRMQQDLAYLPAWYAQPHDRIFVGKFLDPEFIRTIKDRLGKLPDPVSEEDLIRFCNLSEMQEVALWGVSPQSIHLFENLSRKYDLRFILPQWHDELRILLSREKARECLEQIIQQLPGIDSGILPVFYTSLSEVEQAVTGNEDQLLAKAPYSSSGRGLLWLPLGKITNTEKQILHGILKKQGTVSLEKVLNKKLDFAMQFFSDKGKNVRFEGYSLFRTDNKGNYAGNRILSQEKMELVITEYTFLPLLKNVKAFLIRFLSQYYSPFYSGCIGVDMMIYEKNGSYCLHPCVEINLRYNMGYLAMKLHQNYLQKESEGHFYIDFSRRPGDLLYRHNEMLLSCPLIVENQAIVSGYAALCPVSGESNYRAYILVDGKK